MVTGVHYEVTMIITTHTVGVSSGNWVNISNQKHSYLILCSCFCKPDITAAVCAVHCTALSSVWEEMRQRGGGGGYCSTTGSGETQHCEKYLPLSWFYLFCNCHTLMFQIIRLFKNPTQHNMQFFYYFIYWRKKPEPMWTSYSWMITLECGWIKTIYHKHFIAQTVIRFWNHSFFTRGI